MSRSVRCWLGAGLGAVALAGGCGGKARQTGIDDFLRACITGCPPGLDCIDDTCSRTCRSGPQGDERCRELADSAACGAAGIEPDEAAECTVRCSTDADCSSLGEGYHCDAARGCRSDAGAVLACESYRDVEPRSDAWLDVAIENRRSEAIYVQPFIETCSDRPHLVRTERNGLEVSMYARDECGQSSCEDIQRGAPVESACRPACSSGALIRLEPGEAMTLERLTTEYARAGFNGTSLMPASCASTPALDAEFYDGLSCTSRHPITPGLYRLSAQAYPTCIERRGGDCSCETPLASGGCETDVLYTPGTNDDRIVTTSADVNTLPAQVVLTFD